MGSFSLQIAGLKCSFHLICFLLFVRFFIVERLPLNEIFSAMSGTTTSSSDGIHCASGGLIIVPFASVSQKEMKENSYLWGDVLYYHYELVSIQK